MNSIESVFDNDGTTRRVIIAPFPWVHAVHSKIETEFVVVRHMKNEITNRTKNSFILAPRSETFLRISEIDATKSYVA